MSDCVFELMSKCRKMAYASTIMNDSMSCSSVWRIWRPLATPFKRSSAMNRRVPCNKQHYQISSWPVNLAHTVIIAPLSYQVCFVLVVEAVMIFLAFFIGGTSSIRTIEAGIRANSRSVRKPSAPSSTVSLLSFARRIFPALMSRWRMFCFQRNSCAAKIGEFKYEFIRRRTHQGRQRAAL